jgi:hypothetical protein
MIAAANRHKGVLSEQERINFIHKAFVIIDLGGKLLIADREFIGKECGAARAAGKPN